MRYCMGVDVGGTSVKLGLFETEGKLLDKWEIPTRKEKHGEQILPDVAASILKKLEERKIRREDVAGVGMGIPAPVDSEGVVQQTANVGWDIRKLQENSANCLTVCGRSRNDANVAAMARCGWGRKRREKCCHGNPWHRCWRWCDREWSYDCRQHGAGGEIDISV